MKVVVIQILIVIFSAEAFACNAKTLRTSERFVKWLQGKDLSCSANGNESRGKINIFYPKCKGSKPVVRLNAFDTQYLVNEVRRRSGIIQIVSDEAGTLYCHRE